MFIVALRSPAWAWYDEIGWWLQSRASSHAALAECMLKRAAYWLGGAATWSKSPRQDGQLVVTLPREQPAGRGVLSLQFRYTLEATLSGFYLATSTGALSGPIRLPAGVDDSTFSRHQCTCDYALTRHVTRFVSSGGEERRGGGRADVQTQASTANLV